MDDIFDILSQMEKASSNKNYVYYDPRTGEVFHIRNYIQDDEQYPYIEIDPSEITETDSVNNLLVLEKKGKLTLIKIERFSQYSVSKDIYLLPKYTNKEDVEEFDLLVIQDNNLKRFCILLSEEFYNGLFLSGFPITLYATDKNDPNILHQPLTFLLDKTLDYYIYFEDLNLDSCSIYTQSITSKIYKHLELK